jgi:two-component system chemotaxis response regulator CheB
MQTEGPVVVIAGSIEGIHALARLINSLPEPFPAPILAAVHGARGHDFDRLFRAAKESAQALSIRIASEGERPRWGHMYLAPAESNLGLTASGALCMTAPARRGVADQGTDDLFRSAAALYGERVIGVILSGGGDGGTEGFKAITAAGGTRVVQSPSEASHPSMPSSALMRDNVEYTVLLDDMGKLLFDLVSQT